jgi:preprotein translocase subunit SecF
MRFKWWYFAFSIVIIIPGTIALLLWGLKPGIDFAGGSISEVQVPASIDNAALQGDLSPLKLGDLQIQSTSSNRFIVRTKELSNPEHKALQEKVTSIGGKELSFQSVGPTVGKEVTNKAFLSVFVAALAVVLYIAWAFRKVPHVVSSWQFGIATVVALLHDVLVVTGVFAILGHFFGIEVDALFVTALLTVIGFSVHDSIVVFDRIRENLRRRGSDNFENTVNDSVVQTLARSINTSLTVLLTLLALYLFGGASIRYFVLALLIGIASGTYSSIFNAVPVLLVWQQWKEKREVKKA